MPKSLQEILDHADEIAERIEHNAGGDPLPDSALVLARAVRTRGEAERAVAEAVAKCRADGIAWQHIANLLGTSRQSARIRYGEDVTTG